MKHTRIQDSDWVVILKRYQSGESSTLIAKDYNVTGPAICAGLKLRGYKLRNQIETRLRGISPISKKEQDRRYYLKHGEKIRARMRAKYQKAPDLFRKKSKSAIGSLPPAGVTSKICNGCQQDRPLEQYGYRRSGKYQLRPRCKECENNESKNRRKANPELAKEKDRLYRERTPATRRREIKRKAQQRAMLKPENRIVSVLRKQLTEYSKHLGFRKLGPMREIVGCTPEQLRGHLEKQWSAGMGWNNYGVYRKGESMTWHIDHIKPIASYSDLNDPDQQKECFHFSNLQPMWALENIQKSKSIL